MVSLGLFSICFIVTTVSAPDLQHFVAKAFFLVVFSLGFNASFNSQMIFKEDFVTQMAALFRSSDMAFYLTNHQSCVHHQPIIAVHLITIERTAINLHALFSLRF